MATPLSTPLSTPLPTPMLTPLPTPMSTPTIIEREEADWLDGRMIGKECNRLLHPHQREGVKWLMRQMEMSNGGGILADDMGLGKTIQVSAFLSVLLTDNVRTMVVSPTSVMDSWHKELCRCVGEASVHKFTGSTTERTSTMTNLRNNGGVCLISYGMVVANTEKLKEWEWKVMVLDEGHRLKNSEAITRRALLSIRSERRVVMTGTPIQNNLTEFYHLMRFANRSLLGDGEFFEREFNFPIRQSRELDASPEMMEKSRQATARFWRIIGPYFLRREKKDITEIRLPQKFDMVVFVRMSQDQENAYRAFINSGLSYDRKKVLSYIHVLKTICQHPVMLRGHDIATPALAKIDNPMSTLEELIQASGKLIALRKLLQALSRTRNRVLVFSQSVRVLEMVERLLTSDGFRHLRIDGECPPEKRQAIVDNFNADSSIFACVISLGVGATGLTLTGADRVVLLDPSWNPAVDSQAVDRAYRIGQTKDVIVYRFITCASIEDRILSRQVFKGGLFHETVNRQQTRGYFTDSDLSSLLSFDSPDISLSLERIRSVMPSAISPDSFTAVTHSESLKRSLGSSCIGTCFYNCLFDGPAVVGTIAAPSTFEVVPPSADSDSDDDAAPKKPRGRKPLRRTKRKKVDSEPPVDTFSIELKPKQQQQQSSSNPFDDHILAVDTDNDSTHSAIPASGWGSDSSQPTKLQRSL